MGLPHNCSAVSSRSVVSSDTTAQTHPMHKHAEVLGLDRTASVFSH